MTQQPKRKENFINLVCRAQDDMLQEVQRNQEAISYEHRSNVIMKDNEYGNEMLLKARKGSVEINYFPWPNAT